MIGCGGFGTWPIEDYLLKFCVYQPIHKVTQKMDLKGSKNIDANSAYLGLEFVLSL